MVLMNNNVKKLHLLWKFSGDRRDFCFLYSRSWSQASLKIHLIKFTYQRSVNWDKVWQGKNPAQKLCYASVLITQMIPRS